MRSGGSPRVWAAGRGRGVAWCGLSLVMAVVALTGCAGSATPTADGVTVPATAYRSTFEHAGQTLREAGFRIAREQPRLGVLTSQPEAAPTLFEPFRAPPRGLSQALSSTLNHQRRRVRVFLRPRAADGPNQHQQARTAPSPDVGGYRLHVEVVIERAQRPALFVEGTNPAGGVARRLDRAPPAADPAGPALTDRSKPQWVAVARDRRLERWLLQRIAHGPDAPPTLNRRGQGGG